MAGTNLRSRDGLPFNFVDGLGVSGFIFHNVKYPFAGNGTMTEFILPVAPANKASVDVFVKQLYVHSSDYVLNGATLTFTEPPPALDPGETNNIEIKVSYITQ